MSASTVVMAVVVALAARSIEGFSVAPSSHTVRTCISVGMTTMADSGAPPTQSEPSSDVEDVEIPTNLPSDMGMDYIPLATMLATGQLAEADQVRYTKSVFF